MLTQFDGRAFEHASGEQVTGTVKEMIYAVESELGVITEGVPDKMPDQPMQDWCDKWYSANREPRLEDWMMAEFPTEVRVPRRGLTDVVIFGFFGIPAAVKDVIERFEPGVHQFIPFRLVIGKGDGEEVRDYFTLIIGQFADLANVEKSDVIWRHSSFGPHKYWMKKPGVPMVFERTELGEFHLWHTSKHQGMTFMSDELYRSIRKVCPMTGLRFEAQNVI